MNLPTLAVIFSIVVVALSAVMSTAWYLQQKTGNSGWVDVTWSFGVGGVAFIVALLPLEQNWPHWRQMAVAVLAVCWCVRLGLHIAIRTHAATDDPRYRDLIIQWGSDASRRMFWFLQSQAIVGTILALSIILAAHNPDPELRVQDFIGLIILITSLTGEAVADSQLRKFKAASNTRNGICDIGLWRLSRHPNYFFEWLSWLAYPIIAIDFAGQNPFGWLSLAAPILMYWALVYVSGIPPLEDHMLRTRGDAFRAYQQRTRPFFPFPL